MRRLPIYFLIDVSESMVGEPIIQVEKGMRNIIQELRTDPYALETVFVSVIVFAGKEKELFLVMEYISSIIAVSARDSILMKNSMHMNCNMDYYSILSCIFDRKNSLYALKNTTHSIIIKGEND